MGVTPRVFHTPEEYERGAIFAIRQSQNNIISYGHHIFLRLSVALVKLLKGSKFWCVLHCLFLPRFGTLLYPSFSNFSYSLAYYKLKKGTPFCQNLPKWTSTASTPSGVHLGSSPLFSPNENTQVDGVYGL